MTTVAAPTRRLEGAVATAALAIVLYGVMLWLGKGADVGAAMGAAGARIVPTALALALVNYALRTVRWRQFLRHFGHRLPWRKDVLFYVAGFAFTATPAKAGEMARAVYLKPLGVHYAHTASACVTERLLDLAAIVAIACLGLQRFAGQQWLVAVALALVLGLYLALRQAPRLLAWMGGWAGRVGRLLRGPLPRLQRAAQATQDLLVPRLLLAGFILGVLGWMAEATGFWVLLDGLGAPLPWWQAQAIYALALLAGALTFLPGGLVGTEVVMITLLLASGVPREVALAATVLARVATLWFSVALGATAVAAIHGRCWRRRAAAA